MHYHIFAILTDEDERKDRWVSYSEETIDGIGEKLKLILRTEPNVHIEQVMRCEMVLPRGGVIYCPSVVSPEIQESAQGFHYHITRLDGTESYAMCEHQKAHVVTVFRERNPNTTAHTRQCADRLSDMHPVMDECSCGFGALALLQRYGKEER